MTAFKADEPLTDNESGAEEVQLSDIKVFVDSLEKHRQIIREEIASLLTDDVFIEKLAVFVARAMKGEPVYNSDDLYVDFEIDESSPEAFRVIASNLDTDQPKVTVIGRSGFNPTPLSDELHAVFVRDMRKHELKNDTVYWAILLRD